MTKITSNKTGVNNDPFGQTHSHASSEYCFLLFCFSRFEKWGRTDNICENNYPYLVDQNVLCDCSVGTGMYVCKYIPEITLIYIYIYI